MKALFHICIAALIALTGCMASSQKINNVHTGMSKEEVIKAMGKPASITVDDRGEHMNYQLAETPTTLGLPGTPYEVLLVDGKVKSYGRAGIAPSGRRAPMIIPTPVLR